MNKLKRIIAYLIACICLAGVAFSTGCSENDVDKVVEIASIIAESRPAESEAEATETPQQTAQPPAATVEQTQAVTVEQTEPSSQTPEQIVTAEETETDTTAPSLEEQIPEDGEYLSMEQVSTYLHLYGHLPGNYLTKKEAQKKGWVASKGNLWDVAPGAAIGGDTFGNREKLLPAEKGRKYYECDVNYEGGKRGAERLVYSNDGLIYYTGDHYNNFMLLFDGSEE